MTIAYYSVLNKILNSGHPSEDRTGVGTIKLFGEQMRFSLKNNNLPLLTGKHVPFKNVLTELLWFISGDTNVKTLQEQGNPIWNEWAREDGSLGPVYGHQWRMWRKYVEIEPMEGAKLARCYSENIDQLTNAINILKENPNSRRAVVSAWNPSDLKDMALEPCHVLFQFQAREITFHERCIMAGIQLPSRGHMRDSEYMRRCVDASHQMDVGGIPKYTLSCRVDQRSADFFLGVPFNIASYAILTRMVAKLCGMATEELVWQGGDCHIYSNHIAQATELCDRALKCPPLPKLIIDGDQQSIDDFTFADFKLTNYNPMPAIKAPVAV